MLGPLLFTLYMLPLDQIIRKHFTHYRCYADDMQMYLSMKLDETHRFANLQPCFKDIRNWMSCTFLMSNVNKTEVIVPGPNHIRDSLSSNIDNLYGIALASSPTVRNPKCCLYTGAFFLTHVTQILRANLYTEMKSTSGQ